MGSETWFEYGIGTAASFVLVRRPRTGRPLGEAGQVLGRPRQKTPRALKLVKRWRAGAGR